jgi:hemerythrin superfamily protein
VAKDAIAVTVEDHRRVEGLFKQYEGAGDQSDKNGKLVKQMIQELSIHAAIEEQVLYPAMRDALEDGEKRFKEAIQEHAEVKNLLAELEASSPEDGQFDDKVQTLIADVRHHVEEEEQELLPQLRDALDDDLLRTLGEELRSAKGKAPKSPSEETAAQGNIDVGSVSKQQLYDQARRLDIKGRSKMSKEELAKEISRKQ